MQRRGRPGGSKEIKGAGTRPFKLTFHQKTKMKRWGLSAFVKHTKHNSKHASKKKEKEQRTHRVIGKSCANNTLEILAGNSTSSSELEGGKSLETCKCYAERTTLQTLRLPIL